MILLGFCYSSVGGDDTHLDATNIEDDVLNIRPQPQLGGRFCRPLEGCGGFPLKVSISASANYGDTRLLPITLLGGLDPSGGYLTDAETFTQFST